MTHQIRFYLGISISWLSLSMLFDGLNTLVLPARLLNLNLVTGQASLLGLLSFAGLLAGMLVQPLAGALSDRLRPRLGRKGFIAAGVALCLVFLTAFGIADSLFALALAYLLVQVSASLAQAAQQGFIPDLVPGESRGKASGWKAFMDIGGSMLGFVVLGQLLGLGRPGLALAALGLALSLTLLLTLWLVRESRRTPGSGVQTHSILGAFHLDLRKHAAFAWLVLSRFLFLLATYGIGRFLLYFVAARLGLDPDAAAAQAGSLLAALALVTVLAAPFAGWAADRWGRVPVIVAGALLSALGAFLLIFAATGWQILAFGALLSLGSGAFASANWALTADLVPAEEPARFFGLANIGTAGTAAAAGLFGPIVDWADRVRPGSGYSLLFGTAALVFLLSTLALRPVRRVFPAVGGAPVEVFEKGGT